VKHVGRLGVGWCLGKIDGARIVTALVADAEVDQHGVRSGDDRQLVLVDREVLQAEELMRERFGQNSGGHDRSLGGSAAEEAALHPVDIVQVEGYLTPRVSRAEDDAVVAPQDVMTTSGPSSAARTLAPKTASRMCAEPLNAVTKAFFTVC
jgi:hypothetical protein